MGKGEIAHFEQFHLFPQCVPMAFFFSVLEWVYRGKGKEERVKPPLARGRLFFFFFFLTVEKYKGTLLCEK